MAFFHHLYFGILILQIYAHAAPGAENKFEDTAKVEELVDHHTTATNTAEVVTGSSESARQKRNFYPNPYDFSLINPITYPSFRRNYDFPTPYFGADDTLYQIHKRIQEISNVVRPPQIPPPQLPSPQLPPNLHVPQIPIYFPVYFAPPVQCSCDPPNGQGNPTPLPDNPSSPNVTTRFPDMDDDRQNWGLVINNTNNSNNGGENQGGQDFARPISFDPIRLNRPNSRPPPPVDRGTIQGDMMGSNQPEAVENNDIPPTVDNNTTPPSSNTENQDSPTLAPKDENPSRCDAAILMCCHEAQVVYECFADQGCPNLTTYPCVPNTILAIIDKFQKFYGTRNG